MTTTSGTGRHCVFLSLGTNLGHRHNNLVEACHQIEKLIGPIVRQSAFIETQPWGFSSPNAFLNAAVCCHTTLTPRQVLRQSQLIERSMGRTAKSADGIYHDRIIDIDILLYDRLTISEPDLRIPHPLMLQRDFVMRPLMEIIWQP